MEKSTILFAFLLLSVFVAFADGRSLASKMKQRMQFKNSIEKERLEQFYNHFSNVNEHTRGAGNCTDGYMYNYVCDCECQPRDPECDDAYTSRYPEGCSTNDGSIWCKNNTCKPGLPSSWNTSICSTYSYEDGYYCDCGCGAQDPDCSDSSLQVLGCGNFESPICVAGQCQENNKSPRYLDLPRILPAFASKCGYIIKGKSNNGDTTTYFPEVILVNAAGEVVESNVNYSISVSVSGIDADKVKLTGTTKTSVVKGSAKFTQIIAIGPADAEFYLKFSSDPPLVPINSAFPISLKTGDASSFVSAWDSKWSTLSEEGHLVVPSDAVIRGNIIITDLCGNYIPRNIVANYTYYCTFIELENETFYDGICNLTFGIPVKNKDKYNIPVTIATPSNQIPVGNYQFAMQAVPETMVSASDYVFDTVSVDIVPKDQFNCYSYEDADPIVFQDRMISDDDMLLINKKLSDTNVIPVLAFNFTEKAGIPSYYVPIPKNLTKWELSAKRFFVEQNRDFLSVISVNLVDVTKFDFNIEFLRPWCGGVTYKQQKDILGLWLYRLGSVRKEVLDSNTNPENVTSDVAAAPNDVVCFGEGDDVREHLCCDYQGYINDIVSPCEKPKPSAVSVALLIISIAFAVLASTYATTLIAVFYRQSGAVYTVIEDVHALSDAERKSKGRIELLQVIVTPFIAIGACVQNSFLLNAPSPGFFVLLLLVYIPLIALWYITAGAKWFMVWFRDPGVTPPRRLDLLRFVAMLCVIAVSLFNVFWTFCWVTLGLLLDPGRVVPYFVAFVTIFGVAFLKVNSLAQLTKLVEKELLRRLLKANHIELSEEDDVAQLIKLDNTKLREWLINKHPKEEQVDVLIQKIAKFRRFRVKLLVGSVAGSLSVLLVLIIFILLGVESFRVSGAGSFVSGIGSVLEGLAGAGTALNDKAGDKEQEVQELVSRFTKRGANPESSGNDVAMTIIPSANN